MRAFLVAVGCAVLSPGCARAGGSAAPAPAASPFQRTVGEVAGLLRKKGFEVVEQEARSGAIGWRPQVDGRRLEVVDRSRTVPKYVPYEGTQPGKPPPAAEAVAPRLTLYLFPLQRMTANESTVSRLQAGAVEGAVNDAVVFTLQAPQSQDQDDGALRAAVGSALFGGTPKEETATVGGALTATLRHGVLAAHGTAPEPPQGSAGDTPTGARVLLWTSRDGMETRHTLVPLR